MGCVSSKKIDERVYDPPPPRLSRVSSRSSRRFLSSSRRTGVAGLGSDGGAAGNDGSRSRLISGNVVASPPLRMSPEEGKKAAAVAPAPPPAPAPAPVVGVDRIRRVASHRVEPDVKEGLMNGVGSHVGVSGMPNGFVGEHVAAGWPPWLATVAADAVKGWLPRKADSFERLDKIGQGTYSNVYKARDLETGKFVALKKVRFVNMDPESVRFMAREIHILRKLDHPNVVKLEGLITSRMSSSLYLVFEYMEHDLAGLSANRDIKFTEPQIKCYMQQLLRGLDHCHNHGVLHRDIKGSNLLIDNKGILQIADFGLATFFSRSQKQPLTSRVVTLWYRPPELLLGATEYDVSVDLWSAGCILAELYAGKPIMPGRTEVEQLHKIFKLCGSPSEEYWRKYRLPHATVFKPQQPYRRCLGETFRDFPPSVLGLLDSLLAFEPANRGTATAALESQFFSSKPVACDPSSLPRYPPSKEYGIKFQDGDAKRQKAAAVNGHGPDYGRKAPKDPKAMEVPDGIAEQRAIMQRKQAQANPKANNDKSNLQEHGGPGFLIGPNPRLVAENCSTRSGPLMQPGVFGSTWNRRPDNELQNSGHTYSTTSSRSSDLQSRKQHLHQGCRDLSSMPSFGTSKSGLTSRYNRLDMAEPSEKLLDRPSSSHKKDEKAAGKEPVMMGQGLASKKNRIHYSGPLMPPGSNMEEILKEHERQIQQAVRRAQQDKARAKNRGEKWQQSKALLVPQQ